MLEAEADLLTALQESHVPSYKAQAFYGADLTLDDVPLAQEGDLSYSAAAVIQSSGNVYVRRDGDGTSLVPRSMTDPLAPFGQELAISRVIESGEQTWEIPLGRFPIARVPSMKEYWRRYPAREFVVAYDLTLKLRDRFDVIRASGFLQPTAPLAGNTTWQEIQRLSPFPIVQSLPDQPIPASLAYTDSRIDAITKLMDNLGGEPAFNRAGALTARIRDAWLTETVPVFEIPGVIDLSDEMSSDDLFNAVRVRSSVGDSDILSIAQITAADNPLRVGGPFGTRTFTYASPLIETQAAADAAAETILQRVSTRRVKTVKVRCLPLPLIELGDFGQVTDEVSGRVVTGSVAGMSFSLNPYDDMTLELTTAEVSS